MAAPAFGGDAEARARIDDRPLERAHQRHDFAEALEPANRIDHELTGAVIGHVAAALDRDDVDAEPCQSLRRD